MLEVGVSALAVVFDIERSHGALMSLKLSGIVAAAPAHALSVAHLIGEFDAVGMRLSGGDQCCLDCKE